MLRILVVDDDAMVSEAIRIWLEDQGFDVVTADGGASGLEALTRATFDLMIVDIFMPHMHGFESVRIFHERAPTVPLIAISGYAFAEVHAPAPDFLRMALELGASRCMRKPFKPATLMTIITDCLAEAAEKRSVADPNPGHLSLLGRRGANAKRRTDLAFDGQDDELRR